MLTGNNIYPYRILLTRLVLLYYFIFLLWRAACHLLPLGLEQPPLTRVHYDLTFWLVKLSGLNTIIVQNNTGSAVFSIMLIVLCFLSILFPLKKIFIVPFSIGYFLMALVFNIYLCHSAHYLGGMILLSLAFWPSDNEKFELLWDGMRYYCCWIYASAFVWKVLLGSFFQWNHGLLTARGNLAGYLYLNPDTFMADMYYWFFRHPLLLNLGDKIVVLAEGVFVIGFFTKKYDRLMIIMAVFIFLGIYTFADVFFAELLIIIFPLLSGKTLAKINNRMPFLNAPLLVATKK